MEYIKIIKGTSKIFVYLVSKASPINTPAMLALIKDCFLRKFKKE